MACRPAPSRREILQGASALALGSALGPRAARAEREITARQKELYELAKKEGEVTWYTAHSNDTTAQALGHDFEAAFPGIKANAVRTTAQVAYQRLTQEQKAGAIPAGGLIAIGYNTAKLKEADAPKNWPDLTDPKWKDKIALGHPGFSGYVGTWVVSLKKLYGWDFFEKLAKNNPQIGRSINDTVTMLNAGERIVAGSGPNGTAMESAAKGNPLAMIYPTDGSVLIIAPSGIPKGVKHPNAAKLFMEYLLTREASQIWVEHFNESMRPEVKPAGGAKSAADVKTIRPSVEEITKGIPEVIKQWRDTFGV